MSNFDIAVKSLDAVWLNERATFGDLDAEYMRRLGVTKINRAQRAALTKACTILRDLNCGVIVPYKGTP